MEYWPPCMATNSESLYYVPLGLESFFFSITCFWTIPKWQDWWILERIYWKIHSKKWNVHFPDIGDMLLIPSYSSGLKKNESFFLLELIIPVHCNKQHWQWVIHLFYLSLIPCESCYVIVCKDWMISGSMREHTYNGLCGSA